MKKLTSIIMSGVIIFIFTADLKSPATVQARQDKQESAGLAKIAQDAYIYTLPLFIIYKTRWHALMDPTNPNRSKPNLFLHAHTLATPKSRSITSPNNDTLYSSAWLDLGPEPLVVHVPDTNGRYYSIQFMDFYTNNFNYIGRRTTGTRAGDYLVTGPGYKGETPRDLKVIKSPTNSVWLISRILVDGPEDLPNVHQLQNQMSITPLSSRQRREPGNDRDGQAGTLIRPDEEDPWNYLAIVNQCLTENPPPESEGGHIEEFKRIGLGTGLGFDPNRFTEKERAEILEGIQRAKNSIKAISERRPKSRNGWTVPNPLIGNYGTSYFLRAIVAVVGLAALTPEEAMYFRTIIDGEPLHGLNRYVIHFEKDGLPPVDAFWSLTMYSVEDDMRGFLVENPIDRYSVGDRTKDLKYNKDGSLDIYIQHEAPAPDKKSNWLPAPADRFRLTLRAYQPRKELLEGEYLLPQVRQTE